MFFIDLYIYQAHLSSPITISEHIAPSDIINANLKQTSDGGIDPTHLNPISSA